MDTKYSKHILKTKDYNYLIGQKIGYITILGPPFRLPTPCGEYRYLVVIKCDICSEIYVRQFRDLCKKGKLYQKWGVQPRCWKCKSVRHNMTDTRLHGIWKNMLKRCNGKKYKGSKSYFEKQIKVCDEWQVYENFHKWSLENGYTDTMDSVGKEYMSHLSIDRIDSNKDYCPENCRWLICSENVKQGRLNRLANLKEKQCSQLKSL